jgi:membrane-bound ClpP family serine protease
MNDREVQSVLEVQSILFDIDSPGGEAAGMFNLAATIREARKWKRVVASVNDIAASAAYGIASAADEIVVSPTSIIGWIGVVMMHLGRSGELAANGIRRRWSIPALTRLTATHSIRSPNRSRPISSATRWRSMTVFIVSTPWSKAVADVTA